MSAGHRSNGSKNAGAATGHILILLVLAVACYFGVKSFYKAIDAKYIGEPESLPVVTRSDTDPGQNQYGEKGGEIDREAITRRNVFLAKNTDNPGDLLDNLKPSAADLILVGTIIGTDGANRAVIFDVEQKKQDLVREGDVINGASIKQILSGKVIISRRGKNEMLDIAAAEKLRTAQKSLAIAPVQPSLDNGSAGLIRAEDEVTNEDEAPVKVDLERLGEISDGVIIKGRVSSDI